MATWKDHQEKYKNIRNIIKDVAIGCSSIKQLVRKFKKEFNTSVTQVSISKILKEFDIDLRKTNALNQLNKRFGILTVIEIKKEKKTWFAICKCDCGNTKKYRVSNLRFQIGCGCLSSCSLDLKGQIFSFLTVKELVPSKGDWTKWWRCDCKCGNVTEVRSHHLLKKRIKSCGCYKANLRALPSGEGARNKVINGYRMRAKKLGVICELTQDNFIRYFEEKCFYCGSPPSNISVSQHGRGDYHYNGVDRIDNTAGYTLKNCVSCCCNCNYAKNDLNVKDFLNWVLIAAENIKSEKFQNEISCFKIHHLESVKNEIN